MSQGVCHAPLTGAKCWFPRLQHPEEMPARAVVQLKGVSVVTELFPLASSIKDLTHSQPNMGRWLPG